MPNVDEPMEMAIQKEKTKPLPGLVLFGIGFIIGILLYTGLSLSGLSGGIDNAVSYVKNIG